MSARQYWVLLCGLALALIPAPAASQSAGLDCGAPVRARILELGIDQKDVNGVRFFTRRAFGTVTGYDAWVRFHSCTGNLVVVLTRACHFRQSYWRGDCPSDGMVKEEQ